MTTYKKYITIEDFSEAQRLVNTTIISVSSFKRLVCKAKLLKKERSPIALPSHLPVFYGTMKMYTSQAEEG